MDEIGPGALMCVIAVSADRPLRPVVEGALRGIVRDRDVRYLGGDALVVYFDGSTSDLRDRLAPHLHDGESLFVTEFETWSAFGPTADRRWLMRRGH